MFRVQLGHSNLERHSLRMQVFCHKRSEKPSDPERPSFAWNFHPFATFLCRSSEGCSALPCFLLVTFLCTSKEKLPARPAAERKLCSGEQREVTRSPDASGKPQDAPEEKNKSTKRIRGRDKPDGPSTPPLRDYAQGEWGHCRAASTRAFGAASPASGRSGRLNFSATQETHKHRMTAPAGTRAAEAEFRPQRIRYHVAEPSPSARMPHKNLHLHEPVGDVESRAPARCLEGHRARETRARHGCRERARHGRSFRVGKMNSSVHPHAA